MANTDSLPPHVSPETLRHLARIALAEDVGAGDITTEICVPADRRARAAILARQPCVVAGLALAQAVFAELGVATERLTADGQVIGAGQPLLRLSGPARGILTGERTALNFLQRLCGIATRTRQFVEAVAGTRARILDTRKTTPTLRAVEKYAVAVGGGCNHRFGLYDAILIKDNHRVLLEAGGPAALAAAVQAARAAHPGRPVIIEADTLSHVQHALAAGADQILLDNMNLEELREAVALVAGRARLEASGGVRLANVRAIAETGVDYISIGAITHSAPAIDLSLEIEQEQA